MILRGGYPVIHTAFDEATGEEMVVCLSRVVVNESVDPILLRLDLPASVFLQRALVLLRTFLLISVFGAVLIVICVILASSTIVRPIKRITAQADAIAQGRLDIAFDETAERDTANEVALLGAALKTMLAELREMHELKLSAMAAALEQERMREAAKTKDHFFAGMSHEIRTPMNAIIGLSGLLLKDGLTDAHSKHVQDTRISAMALLSLINDILDTSRMEAGKLELCEVDYDFTEMVANICAIISVMAREKGLEFSSVMEGEAPRYLRGDPERTRQILLNLLNNALKYTKEGFVRFGITVERDFLLFAVSDSGIGIKEEVLPVIFDAFSQAPDQRIRQIEGTGLGLNIVHMLTKAMGGKIEVSSEFGKGSVFRVRLPLVQGQAPQVPETDAAAEHRTWNARALVVDDNEINLSVAVGLLEHFGLTCHQAVSGREAVLLCDDNVYDTIFMDHMMPGMDGIEATIAIRSQGGQNAAVPIIALTANVQPSAQDLFIDNGMNDVLAKPIDIDRVRLILARWLPEGEQRAE